jgi:hypothetical protein
MRPSSLFLTPFLAAGVMLHCVPAHTAEKSPVPLPSLAVPKLASPPVIDGRMAEGEWDRAAACTGFVPAYGDLLAHIQTIAWFGYDDTHFYVCFKNYRTARNVLLSVKARGNDDINIVFDHTNEIWFSPPDSPAPTFQTMFNAYPAIWDVKKIPAVGHTQMNWTGRWDEVLGDAGPLGRGGTRAHRILHRRGDPER